MFRFCDGFDSYAATADLVRKGWVLGSGASWDADEGVNGGGCIKTAAAVGTSLAKKTFRSVPVVDTWYYISFWIKIAAAPAASAKLFQVINGTDMAYGVGVSSAGLLNVISSISYYSTSAVQVADNAFHHIELAIKIDTTGNPHSISTYVDGVNVHSNYSPTAGSFEMPTTAEWFSLGTSQTTTLDDVIIWDPEGSGMTATPMGVRTIETLRPDGAGDLTQWTPLAGNNYQAVDEVNSDGDTTYVSAASAGLIDLYTFGNLAGSPTSINAVVVNMETKAAGGGTGNLRGKAKRSSSTGNGTTAAISRLNYHVVQDAILLDPSTAAAWDTTGVNAAQFGMELVS